MSALSDRLRNFAVADRPDLAKIADTIDSLDDAVCDALVAARQGTYDGLTVEQHLELLIERLRGEES